MKRTKLIQFRLNLEEFEFIKKKMEAWGFATFSSFIRFLLLNAKLMEITIDKNEKK